MTDRPPAEPPSTERPSAEHIERLQRRRTRLLFFQGIVFLLWQTSFFRMGEPDAGRAVDHVTVAAYIVWALLLLAYIATGGGPFLPRDVRAVLNDETTVEHRRRGMAAGFWAAMAAALGCYVLGFFDLVSARDVIHTVLTAGVGASLLTFAVLERRAQPHD
jgi:hypothetical protein